MSSENNYSFISDKIHSVKNLFSSLNSEPDHYIFSVLCVKSIFFKDPSLNFNEDNFEMFVDGRCDGGADFILNDPDPNENSDLIIGQSKYYQTISQEVVKNAMLKMANFYNDMLEGHFETVNEKTAEIFQKCNAERSDDSKVKFIFCTSAQKNRINKEKIEKKFKEQLKSSDNVEILFYFGNDLKEEIIESESVSFSVETGKIKIDEKNNYLMYGDESAVIVNVSAYSIKELYAGHNINLLAQNLRYYVKNKKIDRNIRDTIKNNPNSFWYRNNGITVICDNFKIDGTEVHLTNFSMINGGQTTYLISKNENIDEHNDFFLTCKIIKASGESEEQKQNFALDIAQSANTQKPIKPDDLKANSPEQKIFYAVMKNLGIFYKLKRGTKVEKRYKEKYLNTDLSAVKKFCLSAIYQMPCSSRSKPSLMNEEKYYRPIFNNNPYQVAMIVKELLYVNFYFEKKFKIDCGDDADKKQFKNNSKTLCVAFCALASRYYQKNISDSDMQKFFDATQPSEEKLSDLYKVTKNLGDLKSLFPENLFDDKDKLDELLNKIFSLIIDCGTDKYEISKENDPSLNATNFLKKDKNYYGILKSYWNRELKEKIISIFDDFYKIS